MSFNSKDFKGFTFRSGPVKNTVKQNSPMGKKIGASKLTKRTDEWKSAVARPRDNVFNANIQKTSPEIPKTTLKNITKLSVTT